MASALISDTSADPRPPVWKRIIMSDPTPLDPKTDVTKEAKLSCMCEKWLRIAHQVMMLQNSCSKDPDNPTIHMIDHHGSSTALITSARYGCHLCTLLLARIDNPMVEEMQVLEAKDRISRRRADRSAKPIFRVKLRGHLDFRSGSRRHIHRLIREALNSSEFQRREVKSNVKVEIEIVLPHEIAGDVQSRCSEVKLLVKFLNGLFTLPLSHERRSIGYELRLADVVLRWCNRRSRPPKSSFINCVSIFFYSSTPVAPRVHRGSFFL